jgi:hypothetical protein
MHVQNPHMKMKTLPKSSEFQCSNGHSSNPIQLKNMQDLEFTWIQDNTWWNENRISAAETKIIIGGYINLVYKRDLHIMKELHNQSWNWQKTTDFNGKTIFFEFLITNQKDDDLRKHATNAGMRHDALQKPKCIY